MPRPGAARLTPVALFIALCSLCLIAYSGAIESTDALRLYDAVRSAVDWGDFRLAYTNTRIPSTIDRVIWFPLDDAAVEPGQAFMAAPLYLLAQGVPGVGIVHALWLFNALVCAGAGVVLYAFARALGGSRVAALILAVSLVAATALFPYSKTFFREPLTLFFFLLAGLLAHHTRTSGYRPLPLIACAAAIGALLLTRGSAALALPTLIALIVPDAIARLRALLADRRSRLALLTVTAIGALGLTGLIAFGGALGLGARYDVIARLVGASLDYLPTALAGYLLAPGGSLWATSPVLLLAVPGAWLAIRAGRPRMVLAAALAVGGFAVGYAVFNGVFWFGGLSWPPRFLIPTLPFVLLAALPLVERIVSRPRSAWTAVAVLLFAYGVWINVTAVSLPWGAFNRALPPESNGLAEWGPGLYDPAYFRWIVLPARWTAEPSDLAWSLIGMPGFFAAFAGLAAAGVALAVRPRRALVALLVIAWCGTVGLALNALYTRDLRYQPDQPALDALLPILDAETDRDDVILLSSPRYVPYFQNRGLGRDAGRVIALDFQPGERPSEAEPARVSDAYPPALLSTEANRLLLNLGQTRDRLWLVVDGSPDLAWSVRPVEQFMAAYFYPIRAIQTGPLTRAVEFHAASAPDPFGFRTGEVATELRFGESIRLTGVTLSAESVAPGESIGVALWWATDAPLTARYTMALYLRAPDGSPVTQHDSPPRWGFAPTDSWIPGAPIADARGLRLPDGLAPGAYALWVKVYDFGPDGAPRDLPVTAGEGLDGTIGVLPVGVMVNNTLR